MLRFDEFPYLVVLAPSVELQLPEIDGAVVKSGPVLLAKPVLVRFKHWLEILEDAVDQIKFIWRINSQPGQDLVTVEENSGIFIAAGAFERVVEEHGRARCPSDLLFRLNVEEVDCGRWRL